MRNNFPEVKRSRASRKRFARSGSQLRNAFVVIVRYGSGKRLIILTSTLSNDLRMKRRDTAVQSTSTLGLSLENSINGRLRRVQFARKRGLAASFGRLDFPKHR